MGECCSSDAHLMPEIDFLEPDPDYILEDHIPQFQCQLPNSIAHQANFCMPDMAYFE